MRKIFAELITLVLVSNVSIAQLSINSGGVDYTLDFDATVSGVNEGQFNGSGFTPVPAAGQLNSNSWSVEGVSDGILAYGGSQTTGDFARGTSPGFVGTGGIYAFTIGTSNNALGFQPATDDFTPGSITLKILNNTAGSIISLNLSYNIYNLNDQARANFLNLFYSYDDISYYRVTAFDYTSPADADPIPDWTQNNLAGIISGFNIKMGGYMYLRWVCDDSSGVGSRDEFAIDDIVLNANVTTSTIVSLSTTSLTFNENYGSFNVLASIQNPSAVPTTVDLVLLNAGTFSADISGYTSQTFTFPSNNGTDQSISITITDDALSEGVEDLYFVLSNVSGGDSAFVGVPDTFHLKILDNELINLVINEVLADPDAVTGNANGDGVVSVTQDEFIELVNLESYDVDLSGWTISDSIQVRHTFSNGTILTPGNVITIFGGGTPTGINGLTQTASPFGGLGLNNTSDSIIIKNSGGVRVVVFHYGSEAGNNQSIARNPDVTGAFVQHTTIVSNPVAFSPGAFNTDGTPLPVELSSFTATVSSSSVKLYWVTSTEVNNYGFDIERNTPLSPFSRGEAADVWEKIGFVYGSGNSNSPKIYSLIDDNVSAGSYLYRLKQIDNDGKFEYSKTVDVSIIKPDAFTLEQNYPNPFNPTTKIKYTIPSVTLRQAQGDVLVSLKVFDVLGNEAAVLVNETQQPGNYEVEFKAEKLSSGVYYYRLQAGTFVETKKMILLR